MSLAVSLGWVLALYGRALGFSFLFDDTIDLTRVEGRSYLSLLTSSEGYSYFRPIPFILWKLSHQFLGYYNQPLLHALPLVAHALVGWLLFLLVRRLGAGYWAVFPALLFLSYPFSYQDVAIVGVVFHPLAGMAILASLNLYQRAREAACRRQLLLHAAALLATALALWSHESGVIVLPLVAGLEVLLLWRRAERRPSFWLAGHLALTGLFMLQWLTVERAPFGETVTLSGMQPKALFYLQGFIYPVSAQLRWLNERLGHAPGMLEAAAAAFVVVFGAFLLSAWLRGRDRRHMLTGMATPALGLLVALAASLPAMARLSWGYIEDAPRLLYLTGLGTALFWGLLPMLKFRKRWLTIAWRTTTALLLVGVIVQSWLFIDLRMDMFDHGSTAVAGIVEAGDRYAGQQILVVNAPSWLAMPEYEYLYGHLGAQVIPAYIGLDRVIYASSHRGSRVDADSISLDPDVSGGRFTFGPHGTPRSPEELDRLLREGRMVIAVQRGPNGFRTREGGRLLPGRAELRSDSPGTIDGKIGLSAVRIADRGGSLAIYVSWNVLDELDAPADVEIRVRRASDGRAVRERPHVPLMGTLSPALWRIGDRIDDIVWIDGLAPGTYSIQVGLRARDTAEFLPPGLIDIGSATVTSSSFEPASPTGRQFDVPETGAPPSTRQYRQAVAAR